MNMNTTHTETKNTRGRGILPTVALALLIAGGNAPQAWAATAFWHGAGSNANWSTAENWSLSSSASGSYTLVNGDTLRWFPATAPQKVSTNDIVGLTVTTISFQNSGSNIVLNGNKLRWSTTIDGNNADSPVLNLPFEASDNGVAIGAGSGKTITLNGNITEAVSSTVVQFMGGTVNLNGANSWTGVSRLGSGSSVILYINTLANKDTAQSLGKGDIEFGYASGGAEGGGTIVYTGAATTTDKGFRIGRSMSTFDTDPGNAFINNGSGAVVWTGTQAKSSSIATDMVFTLGGNNTDNNDWQSVIDNNTATRLIGIAKTGTGKWILSGDNTYSGPTDIQEGALVINGDQSGATGTVTVASGAALGGNGRIGGDVTLASGGKLKPGDAGGGVPSKLTIDGAFSYENGTLDLSGLASLANGTHVLATFPSRSVSSFASVVGLPSGASVGYTDTSITLKTAPAGTMITIR